MFKIRSINAFIILLAVFHFNAIHAVEYPDLPEAVSNNAVAYVESGGNRYLLSMMGLGAGKDYKDVHNKVWSLKLGDNHWKQMQAVPSSLSPVGRLASVAVSVKGEVYLFGGYTVAADHSEISSPDNFKYQIQTDSYVPLAPTPVPVDDVAAVVYQQRYIYLISGWHNDGNVNLVQVYDIKTDSWQQASPFLGAAVFGQAAGIVGNQMLVCDGVKVQARKAQRRTFKAESACYSGNIDEKDIKKVDWRIVQHPTGAARYRMAATGISKTNKIYFLGGSENPYNYNGVGYNGVPSKANSKLWIYDVKTTKWSVKSTSLDTMDHRGLIAIQNQLVVIGGMNSRQEVLNKVHTHKMN